ncbi:hypothetical protein HAX54_025258 [Datura stramonium]|uniref:Uncharacterized protein n=1 Tax=Datura stramonium TaxID=4076 RepID=A0ABS8V174_DATST|nr:hypothetical protein [Datura stramonium]
MTMIQEYEKQSGQKVNKERSLYYLHQKVDVGIPAQLKQITGMVRGFFPMNITHARKRKVDYGELIDQVKGKLQTDYHTCHPMRDIGELLTDEGWDFDVIQGFVPKYVVEHVRQTMSHMRLVNQGDKPWWTKTSIDKFSVKSA